MKLKDLGEREIINRLMAQHSRQSPKDDCSLLEQGNDYFMVSTDVITPETHVPSGASPEQIGSFFANINISDIAAMAGVPLGLLTAYSASPETEVELLEGFESGINSVLRKHDMEHLGGDMKEGSALTLTGVALGKQKKELVRKRAEIKEGQILGVTNRLGRSSSGYVYYRTGYRKDLGISLMMGVEARVREAIAISESGGRFMMDLSDGVFSSLRQMKDDYGVGFKIVEDSVPEDQHVERAIELSGASRRDILLGFGGDYEILFTIDNESYGSFMEAMESHGVSVSIIGQVWDGDNIIFDGEQWESVTSRGYEHFRKKPALGRIA